MDEWTCSTAELAGCDPSDIVWWSTIRVYNNVYLLYVLIYSSSVFLQQNRIFIRFLEHSKTSDVRKQQQNMLLLQHQWGGKNDNEMGEHYMDQLDGQ